VAADPPGIRRILLDVTLGDAATAEAAAAAALRTGVADDVVRLAWAWRVVPRLHERVLAGASLGAAADAQLARMAIAAAAQSTLYFHRAADVVGRLDRAGVPVAAFKGVAAIAALYGTPSARMLRDVDIVIDPAAVTDALRVLGDAGFALTDDIDRRGGADEWIEMLHAPSLDLRNLYVSLRTDEGFEADVHLQIGPAPPPRMLPGALLGRRVRVRAAGSEIPVLAPVDLMLLNVYHSLKDLLALTSAARDLNDLAAWWARGRDQWSVEEFVAAARESRLDAPLLAFWRVLARADASGPVGDGVVVLDRDVSHASRRDADRIVQLFYRLVDTGRLSSGILTTLSPGRARRYREQRRHQADAHREGVETPRRTVRGFAAGLGRVAREAADVHRLAAYRALVRAQRRYR
jgi:hypothetical protein